MDSGIAQALDRLQGFAKESNASLDRLVAAMSSGSAEDRKLAAQFRKTLRADLEQQAVRFETAISRLPVQTAGAAGNTGQVAVPRIDVNAPLNKWFKRTQELHNNLVNEIRGLGKRFAVPTQDVAKASEQNFGQLRSMFEKFMIENARNGKEAEEFQRSLRKDFQSQASLLGRVVSEIPTSLAAGRDTSSAAPAQPNVGVINDSLKQWLERTQDLHESMLKKMQSNSGGNGNGHGMESGLAVQEFKQAVGQHHESLRKVLQDFMTENSRQTQSSETFRSELREDIRSQTNVLSRVVAEMSNKMNAAGDSDAAATAQAPATVELNLDGPMNEWLGKTEQLHRSLIDELRASRQEIQFPTNEFRQITDEHHNSLRKLLEDWTNESIRRVRATDELRTAIQQDIKVQVDRLKKIADAPTATPVATRTTGTITASAAGEESGKWRENVGEELAQIIAKLDRMQERMEEIFQI